MRRFLQLTLLFLLTCLLTFPLNSWAENHLTYQNRGSYYEGIKPKPVSGYDIKLISVLADYRESTTSFPEELKIQFYLLEDTDVYIIVRELDYQQFYWLDKVTHAASWSEGFGNTFTWSTGLVLQDLDDSMNMYDLGVLTCLGQSTPSSIEHIAPAIFFHTSPPATVTGYWFTLKPNGRALVQCAVYPKEADEAIWSRTFRRKPAGQLFSVKWVPPKFRKGRIFFW
jgi:hypothetical protein